MGSQNRLQLGRTSVLHLWHRLVLHCCYQGAFEEVNIPINRALLPNFEKKYDELVLPEMPVGLIYKKILHLVHICVKNWLLVPRNAISYH